MHMRLYCQDVSGSGTNIVRNLIYRETPQLNLIRQAVDTLVSRIGTQKPKPQYIVTDGSFDLERVARLRTRVLEGQLYDSGGYEVMPEVLVDALALGDGFAVAYLDPDTAQIGIERAHPGEIVVDPREGMHGNPRRIHRKRPMSKDAIRDLYPDVSDALLSQARGPTDSEREMSFLPLDRTIDEVMVYEGWFSPPGKDKKGGRHVLALSSCTLADEDWDYEIPVIHLHGWKRQIGYWGIGVAELGAEAQDRYNQNEAKIEHMQRLGSTAWVLADRNADVRVERLTNEPLSIVRYTSRGAEPKIQVFSATPLDLVQENERIRERFLSMLGVSQMAAEARKPAGLDSAVSQRAYEDITSQRHATQSKQFEDAYMRIVEVFEGLNDHAQKSGDGYSVSARTQRGLVPLVKQVKWSDAHLPREQYRLTCFPTSQLPTTVPGRLAALSEWVASGFVSRPYAQKQLIDMPDDDMQRLELADLDFVMWQIEEMLDGKGVSPESYQDMSLAADTTRRAYLQVKSRGAPEALLETMRNFVDDCMDEIKKQKAAQAAENTPPTPPPDQMAQTAGLAPTGVAA